MTEAQFKTLQAMAKNEDELALRDNELAAVKAAIQLAEAVNEMLRYAIALDEDIDDDANPRCPTGDDYNDLHAKVIYQLRDALTEVIL